MHPQELFMTHRIHVWFIYHIYPKKATIHVGKYTVRPMDGMGDAASLENWHTYTAPVEAEQYFIQVALKIDVKHSQVASFFFSTAQNAYSPEN